jgi:hypothetical protein
MYDISPARRIFMPKILIGIYGIIGINV